MELGFILSTRGEEKNSTLTFEGGEEGEGLIERSGLA
jgi:hypothetical protein